MTRNPPRPGPTAHVVQLSLIVKYAYNNIQLYPVIADLETGEHLLHAGLDHQAGLYPVGGGAGGAVHHSFCLPPLQLSQSSLPCPASHITAAAAALEFQQQSG